MSTLLLNSHNLKQPVNKCNYTSNQRFKRILHKKLSSFGFNLINVSIDDCQMSISTMSTMKLLNNFETLIIANIDKRGLIKVSAKIIKDGYQYIVTNKQSRGLINQFINTISQVFRRGSMSLHSQKLNVVTTLTNKMSPSKLKSISPQIIIKKLLEDIQMVAKYNQYNIYRILYICGEIDQIFFKVLKNRKIIIRDLVESHFEKLDQLIRDLIFSKRDKKPLRQNQKIREFRTAQALPKVIDSTGKKALYDDITAKKQAQFFQKSNSNKKTSDKEQQRTADTAQTKDKNLSKEDIQKQVNLEQYQNHLKQSAYPLASNQNRGIYSLIEFHKSHNLKTWQSFVQTSNTQLLKGYFKFRFFQGNNKNNNTPIKQQQYVAKYLIKKMAKGIQSFQKCQHQKSILKELEGKSSLHIGKFYHCNDQQYKNSIIMDLYSESSCDIYLRDNNKSISIRTKFMLLFPIIQGMRLLRDSGIVHLDMKFQNVLIGRALVPRLTDFGQSYNRIKAIPYSNGYTFPYVPHQQFSSKQSDKKNSRDTYSFGIMLDLIFSNRHILSFRRSNQQKFKTWLQHKKYPKYITFLPQKYLRMFTPKMSILIWTMVLLSIHVKDQKRPNQDIIAVILKVSQNFVDSLIS